MVLYILVFKFLDWRRKYKDSEPSGSKHYMNLIFS